MNTLQLPKKRLSLAFIGGGINSAIGATHRIAAQMDGYFNLVSGCFSREATINRRTAETWNVPRVYSSWQELMENEKERVDAFVVLTPTPSHFEIVDALLKEGCPVICEKALTASIDTASLLRRTLERHKSFLAVTYNYTGYPMVRELKVIIKKGGLGAIKQIMIEMPQETFVRQDQSGIVPPPQRWRLIDGEIPTISLDLGVHLHHLIYFLTGEHPLKVTATQDNFGDFPNIVDNVNVIISYTGGVTCNMWYSKIALGHRNGLRIRLYGEEGAAEWYQMEPEKLILQKKDGGIHILDTVNTLTGVPASSRYNRFKPGHPAGFIEAFANLYDDIAMALSLYKERGAQQYHEYVFSVDEAVEGLQLMDAIRNAAIRQKWVDF